MKVLTNFLMNFLTKFFDKCLDKSFDKLFWTNIFWQTFFDEYFLTNFLTNFLTYILLTVASFRIEISSILFIPDFKSPMNWFEVVKMHLSLFINFKMPCNSRCYWSFLSYRKCTFLNAQISYSYFPKVSSTGLTRSCTHWLRLK